MKILFPVMGAENISVAYMSSVLKEAGHEVQVAFDRSLFDDKQYFSVDFLARFFSEKERVIQDIVMAKPDILAMSCFTDNYQWCLEIVRGVLKEHPCITIWGGIHPTSCPDKIIHQEEIDYLIVGEGELPILELLKSMETGDSPENILNLWYKKEDGTLVQNKSRKLLNSADFPTVDKTIFEKFIPMEGYYMTVSSKGCIATCSFCQQNFYHRYEKEDNIGLFLREKTVDDLLEELRYMKEHYGIKYIDIKNNVLSGNQKWLNEFLERYPKEVGLPFRIMGHVLLLRKKELAEKLKKAGCHHVQIGIESWNQEVRRKILNRKETNAHIIQALDNMEAAGLRFSGDIIVGLPEEKEDDLIFAVRSFAKYKNLVRASIFWLQYLPGVEITRAAYDKGLINDDNLDLMYQGRQKNYLSTGSPMEADRMRILKTYHIMFRLLPITSEKVMNFLLDSKIYNLFRFIPFQTVWIIMIDVFVSYVRRDYYSKWIMNWYFKQIFRHLRGKEEYISDILPKNPYGKLFNPTSRDENISSFQIETLPKRNSSKKSTNYETSPVEESVSA